MTIGIVFAGSLLQANIAANIASARNVAAVAAEAGRGAQRLEERRRSDEGELVQVCPLLAAHPMSH